MDDVNPPQGQGPQDYPSTQPYRFTPGWPGGAPQYGPPPQYGAPQYGAQPPGDWQPPGGPPQQPVMPAPDEPQPPQDKRHWTHSRVVRWTAGVAAAIILAGGGTLAGMKLASSGSTAQSNSAQAVALDNALGGGSGGCLFAEAGASTGSAKASVKGSHATRCLHAKMRRIPGLYGDIAFHTGTGTETLAFQRGLILSNHGGTLTVESQNGTTWSWQSGDSSRIKESGNKASASDLKSGARVFVAGEQSGSTRNAQLVVVRPAQKKKSSSNGSSAKKSSSGKSSAGSGSSSATSSAD